MRSEKKEQKNHFLSDTTGSIFLLDEVNRSRLLTWVLYFLIASNAAIGSYYTFFYNVSNEVKLYIVLILVTQSVLYITALLFLRALNNYEAASNITIAGGTLVVITAIYIDGGLLASSGSIYIIVLLMFTFLIMGRQRAIPWAALYLISIVTMSLIDLSGFNFPAFVPPEMRREATAINWTFAFILLIGLIYLYELNHDLLQNRISKERERYFYLANHDPLTNVKNRRAYVEELDKAIARQKRTGNNIILMIIDLNKFKPINDSFGHQVGDKVLDNIARALEHVTRESDTIARLGGDEFAIIFEQSKTTEKDAALLGEKISRAIKDCSTPQIPISASIGISIYPQHSHSSSTLQAYADKAMYEAKKSGGKWKIHQST